jgi:DNA-binding response OmpR family regulator
MDRPLAGRSILIVEDEPIVALDIAAAFEKAGAQVTTTTTLRHATILVENDGLSAAVLDHGLGDGDSSSLCERLTERNIPFVIYSGFGSIDDGACREAPHVSKPANPEMLIATVAGLLDRQQISN